MTIQNRPRLGFGLNTNLMKLTGVLLLTAAFIAQPYAGVVNALQVLNYTDKPFTSTELSTNWTADRKAPSGGSSSVSFGGRSTVLEMTIDKTQQSSNVFYTTEGLQRQLPDSDSIKADVYVDSDWTGKTVRAGLWGVGEDASNAVSSYPIIEYTTDGFTGWRYWSVDQWINLTGVGVNTGWNTLAITHDAANHEFDFSVNGTQVASANDEGSARLGAAILNSKNYGLDNYSAHWSNFAYGNYGFVAETPTNAKFSNPTTCGGTTNQINTVASWSPVIDASSYTYKAWKEGHPTYHSLATAYTVNVNGTSQPGAFNIGDGKYYFSVRAVYPGGQTSDWSTPCAATYDATAPSVPTNGQPNNSYKSTNVFDFTWNASADSTTPVTYEFQSSMNPTQSGGVLTTALWKSPTLTTPMIHSSGAPDGVWYWQVRAKDAAGNTSAWSPVWKMTIDSVAPVANITTPAAGSTLSGVVTVTGTVTDANPMNSYFVITGPSGYSKTSFYGDGRLTHSFSWDTTKTPGNGSYTIQFETRDKAGNKTAVSVKKISVTVNNPLPTLNTEDFGVGSWRFGTDGFTGMNVGFNIHDFKTVSGITVDLYDQDGKKVTNTSSASLIDMLNNGLIGPSLSTPFVTQGTLVDTWCNGTACWDLGSYDWTHSSKNPTKTVITVTGTDIYGHATTRTAVNSTFSEAAADFQSILPPAATTQSENAQQGTNNSPLIRNVLGATRTNNISSLDTPADTSESEVLGASTTASKVAASADPNAAVEEGTPTASNPAIDGWVWWTAGGLAVAAGAWWMIAALRRSGE